MKNTEAFIHVHVESNCASAGTMLMALAHNLYVNEYVTTMYHNIQWGSFGHGGNVEAEVKHVTAASKKLIRDVYAGLLTPNEIARLEDGLELYMDADEVMDRFEARTAARRKEIEQANKPAKKPRQKRIKVVPSEPQQEFVE
jgi:ATP-dependent protease ClpP protease subunit